MIAFVIENENPYHLNMTISSLQTLSSELEIITISSNEINSFYMHLGEYCEHFFIVLQAGDKIVDNSFLKLLLHIEDLNERDAGIVGGEEKEETIPLVWRTKAVLSISQQTIESSPFRGYLFHQMYFYLMKNWTWKRLQIIEYINNQFKTPRWKKDKEQWELLYPIISGEQTEINKMEEPVVSVVICTYNDAEYLYCAIHSVLVQSNPNWELIIVDDGSTDHTHEVLSFFKCDPRVIVWENESNQGKAYSLNQALSISKGKWLLELDADDWLSVDCINEMVCFGKKHEPIFLYGNHYEWIQRYNNELIYSKVCNSPTSIEKKDLLENPLPITPRMYNTQFLREIGGWCVSDLYGGRLYEDLYIISRCISYPTFHITRSLYHRRIRRDSITQRESKKFEMWKKWLTQNIYLL